MVDHRLVRNGLAAILVASAGLALAGCSFGERSSYKAPSGRTVQAGEFEGTSTASPTEQSAIPVRVVSVEQARSAESVGAADPGEPSEGGMAVLTSNPSPLIDAKVGDLNGAPVFAKAWLKPISGRLKAEGERLDRDEFRAFASNLIRDRLAGELKDELLYAEIQAELTAQEKAGLRAVLAGAQREQVRRAGGSVTVANQALKDANDQTIDTFVRDRERQILVAEKYRREIDDKVQVSQRDIKLFYERNRDQFNPPPVATIYRIRVPNDDAAGIAEVTRRLAAGEAFEAVAMIEANTMSEPFSEREIVGEFSEFEFYSIEPLNEAARTLTLGRTAGPIEHGSSVSWLHLSSMVDSSVSLYDSQLAIENQLKASQRRELEQRYIFKLIRRAGLAEFDEIISNLTDIAELWYYTGPPAAAGELNEN